MSSIEVISVARADRPMWIYKLSLDSVRKHFPTAKITIVCPSTDVRLFSHLHQDHAAIIMSEDEYMPSICVDDLKSRLASRPHRAGWYYQQFLKMHYCRHASHKRFLIWDLDTVMLNPIDLVSPRDEYHFGCSTEYHLPYFHTIDTLLGRGVFPGVSAICQYMYVETAAMSSLLSEIEFRTGLLWPIGILSVLPQRSDSEFSEYETFATYVFRRYQTKCIFKKARLFRYGRELASSYSEAVDLFSDLSNKYDLLSFENHNPSFLRKAYATVIYFIVRVLRTINSL